MRICICWINYEQPASCRSHGVHGRPISSVTTLSPPQLRGRGQFEASVRGIGTGVLPAFLNTRGAVRPWV
jgi:hypothetical protein